MAWREVPAMEVLMRYSALVSAAGLAIAIVAAGGTALAQDTDDRDRGWSRGPWHMWDDDWRGRGMMGPGMMGMMGPGMMGRGMMPMMFVMMDTDGDGAVSFEEMQAVHKRMFDLVDGDKDGKVTVAEMRSFMRASEEEDEE
jgi:hypothetical protein